MRKLIINTFITLDGVMQAPGGPEEDTAGGFKHGGWSFYYWDDLMGETMNETMSIPFDLLLGRKTYEIFAAHWPHIKNDPTADKLNAVKKYVVSKTLHKAEWNNSSLIKDDVVDVIMSLKEQEGPEIQVHGSSNLIQTLIKNNLIDEYHVWTFPVTVGKGKRLFDEGTTPSNMRLVSSKVSGTGVIITVYEPGGELKTGSFALDNTAES